MMDAPHGFTVDAFISNLEQDVHCTVLRCGSRVVLTFRGSSSAKYVTESGVEWLVCVCVCVCVCLV
jgi:hypothetical protein